MPSMTVSPIWATMPPSTVGSTMTLTSTALAGGLAPGRPRAGRPLVVGRARSPSAPRPPSAGRAGARPARRSGRRWPAGRGPGRRRRPSRSSATVTSVALPASRSSTICWRRAAGRCGSVSAVAQLVGALEHPGEAEQLVVDLVEVLLVGRDRRATPRRSRRSAGRFCCRRPRADLLRGLVRPESGRTRVSWSSRPG